MSRLLSLMIIFFCCNVCFADSIIATIGEKTIVTEEELNQYVKIEILLKNPNEINNKKLQMSFKDVVLEEVIELKMFKLYADKVEVKTNQQNIDQQVKMYQELFKKTFKKDILFLLEKDNINKKLFYEKVEMEYIRNLIIVVSIQQKSDIDIKNANQIEIHSKFEEEKDKVAIFLKKLYYVEKYNLNLT